MNFNKTTEYALRIMSLIARDSTRLYTTREIYDVLRIPFRYLRRLMTHLTRSGLIEGIQGKNGGYRLAKQTDEISLMDIVNAIGDNRLSNECFFGFDVCRLSEKCFMHEKWTAIKDDFRQVLLNTTLSDLKSSLPRRLV